MPKNGYKQSKLDPKEIARWWQEADEQIRLAHPHESKENREKLTEKYIQSRIQTVLRKKSEIPDPGEKKIAEWYDTEMMRLRSEVPDTPLKQRERIATKIVSQKIKFFRRTIQLDHFFQEV
jgi:hypothetical protein